MQRYQAKNYAQHAIPNHFSNFNLENPVATRLANMRFFLLNHDVVHCVKQHFSICWSKRRFLGQTMLSVGMIVLTMIAGPVVQAQDLKKMFAEGEMHFNKGEHVHAVAYYTGVVEYDPANVPALLRRGMSYHQLGALDRALKDLDTVLSVDLNNVDAFIERGKVFVDAGRTAEACVDWRSASDLGDKEAVVLMNSNGCKN